MLRFLTQFPIDHRRRHLHEMQESQEHWSGANLRQLLFDCAAAIGRRDWPAVAYHAAALSRRSSPLGDAEERLAHYLVLALSRCAAHAGGAEAAAVLAAGSEAGGEHEDGDAYLALNQVTPFVRFAHLSANQAILEAVDGERAVHIVDCGIVHGLQWPPLMQALVERRRRQESEDSPTRSPSNEFGEEFRLRITATGPCQADLEATGARLRDFARTLELPFEFEAICSGGSYLVAPPPRHLLRIHSDETLVVNSMAQLHCYDGGGCGGGGGAVAAIRALSPRVVTIAEREHLRPPPLEALEDRVAAALEDYAPIFDSLDATLPPGSSERQLIERSLLGREIAASVLGVGVGGAVGGGRAAMASGGFVAVAPSDFSIAQARLLLRLHYPSEGYRLLLPCEDHNQRGTIFISWQSRPLFAISSWTIPSAIHFHEQEQAQEQYHSSSSTELQQAQA